MATLDSDKVWSALQYKLGCEVDESGSDHVVFFVNEGDRVLARTHISKGPKHTLTETLLLLMGRELGVGGGGNLVKFEKCKICKEDFMKLIRASNPPQKPKK